MAWWIGPAAAEGAGMTVTTGVKAAAARLLALAPRLRRQVPALVAAAAVNLLLLGAIALTARPVPTDTAPVIEVTLAAPDLLRPEKRQRDAAAKPLSRTEPRWRMTPPKAESEVAPVVVEPPPAPAPSRWTVRSGGDLDAAVVPGIREKRSCSPEILDRLDRAARAACLARLAAAKPDGPAAPTFALKDPGGEWARQAARQAERRKPMSGPPVGDCFDRPGGHLGGGCTR
jgi:hypothetical protein